MNHKTYLTSEEILSLPSSLLEKVLLFISTYDMEKKSKNTEDLTSEDIELYSKAVEAQFRKKKDKGNYIDCVGFLSEELGLEVLKDKEFYQIEDVREYEMPKSHVDYINTFTEEEKSSLKNTFFEKYIEVSFVPSTVRRVRELLDVHGTPYISLGDSYACEKTLFTDATTMGAMYTGTTNGYLFPSMEEAKHLVEKIADFEFAVNLAKEKLVWEQGDLSRKGKFYNVPFIVPTFSEEVREYTVAGIWSDPKADFTAAMVVDVELDGSVDEMFYAESESIYVSDCSTTNQRVAAAKELGIPVTQDKYVPKGREQEIYQKVREDRAAEEAVLNAKVEKALADKGLTGNFYYDNMYLVIYIEYSDGFIYEASSESRYINNIDTVMDFIDDFDKEDIEDTYQWEKERQQFLADKENLPSV